MKKTITTLFILVSLAVADQTQPSSSCEIAEAIPNDALVAVMLSPTSADADDTGLSSTSLAGFFLQQLYQTGVLGKDDPETQFWLDLLATLPLAGKYPMGIVLTDVKARPLDGGGVRLDGLSGAVIFATNGDNGPIATRIQELLNLRSDRDNTTLSKHTEKRGIWFELKDKRLPTFATVEWGAMEGYYIIGVGKGIWSEIADTIEGKKKTLKEDSWYRKQYLFIHNFCTSLGINQPKNQPVRNTPPNLTVYLDAKGLRKTLQSVMGHQVESMLDALKLSEIERGVWAVSVERRDIQAASALRIKPYGEKAEDHFIPITVPPGGDPKTERAVPAEANWYVILDASAGDLIMRGINTWLEARRKSYREFVREWWVENVDTTDISMKKDLLDNLGNRIIIHDAPPHPLRIPLFWTIQLKVDQKPERVRIALDRMMEVLITLVTPVKEDGTLEKPWLKRSDDGLWYVQFGLYGPAIGVDDDWMILSYSPSAVRENMARNTTQPSTQPDKASASR